MRVFSLSNCIFWKRVRPILIICLVVLIIIFFQSLLLETDVKNDYLEKDYISDVPLIMAVVNGNLLKTQEIISQGCDVNQKTEEGDTPLQLAAVLGDKKIAELLINSGADINSQSGFCGNTPLILATVNSNWAVIELLIKSGADVSIKNCKSGNAYGYSKDKKRFLDIIEKYSETSE